MRINEQKILMVTLKELNNAGIGESAFKHSKSKGHLNATRACNGKPVEIEYESMPDKYKRAIVLKYGNPYEIIRKAGIKQYLITDYDAFKYYSNYQLPNGGYLPKKHIEQYTEAAEWLNMIVKVDDGGRGILAEMAIDSKTAFYEMLCSEREYERDEAGKFKKDGLGNRILVNEQIGLLERENIAVPHTYSKLKETLNDFRNRSYMALISGKFLNNNAKKVVKSVERLLLSLYMRDEKPYIETTHVHFQSFMADKLQIVDYETKEQYFPQDFYRHGQPLELDVATVGNYINKPANRLIVDKVRLSDLEYNGKHRPHVHRHNPFYAFSKISIDDLSIPFKLDNGKRVWSYQVFDVATGCVIGVSFGKDKTAELYKACLADMFKLCAVNGWGVPAEIEVERHISTSLKGSTNDLGVFEADVLTAGALFPFVHFCRGGNPQEKSAEGSIKAKKLGFQNKRKGFQRRPFARLEANRLNQDKNNVRYSYKQVIANELKDIYSYNNSLHPDQELYAGLTRWEVLQQFVNPNLSRLDKYVVARYVGDYTPTTLRRTQYVEIKGNDYMIPTPELIYQLSSLSLQAYFLPDSSGDFTEVYLYQDNRYICTARMIDTFNKAQIEATEADKTIAQRQYAYIAQFEKLVKEHRSGNSSKIGLVEDEDDYEYADTPYTKPAKRQKSNNSSGIYNVGKVNEGRVIE